MDAAGESTWSASVTRLAQVAIQAADLPTTIVFFGKPLGLKQAPRPPLDFPGAWLGTAGGNARVHLYAGECARGAGASSLGGSAAIDHVSFWARGHEAQRAHFAAFSLPYCSQPVPARAREQLFVHEPNGVLIELTCRLQDEPDAVVGERAGALRFEPQRYVRFGV